MNKAIRLGLVFSFLTDVAGAGEVVIENATIVSAHLKSPAVHQYVQVIDGRISKISSQPIVALSEQANVIAAEGKFLTPGLMDSHVHIGSIPGIGFISSERAKKNAALVDEYLAQQPKSFLYFGVTQVLNLGSSAGSDVFTESDLHPDFFTCQPIPVIGGYPDLDANYTLSHSSNFILEPEIKFPLPNNINRAEHTVGAVISRLAKTGTQCIKIYVENGFGDASDWPVLATETLIAIREEADKYGLQTIAHANAIDMYQIALQHKVDVIAHGLWNWGWPEDQGKPPVAETLDWMMESNTAFMPTIQVMQALQGMYDQDFLADNRRRKVLPKSLLNWFNTEQGQWFKRELSQDFGDNLDDVVMHRLVGYGLDRAIQATAYVAAKDYPLLLASDFPSSPSYAAAPGLSSFHELLNLSQAGASNQGIFEAATVNGPKQFCMQDRYGTVEEGKVANLLLLSANPLEDVKAWEKIEWVILNGQPILRDSLAVN